MIQHPKQMGGGHTLLLYLGTMYQNNMYASFQSGPHHNDPQKEYQPQWCCFSKQCLQRTWALSFLLLHHERGAKMGTGRMSLEKPLQETTLSQRAEIKVFRLCQFI